MKLSALRISNFKGIKDELKTLIDDIAALLGPEHSTMRCSLLVIASVLLAGAGSFIPQALAADEPQFNPVEMINAFENAFGVHKGERRNHAKGTCAVGEFVGMPDAAKYSRSALFSGKPVPVIARFSQNGGNPHKSDAEKGVQGLGLEFKLPDGSLQHMTMINVPTP